MLNRRINAVGLDGALFERDVTRTLARVDLVGGLTIHWPIPRTRDALGHSGVQPWSAGAIFPATIATVERYPVERCAECGEPWPCTDSKRRDIMPALRAKHGPMVYPIDNFTPASVSYRLTLDGHSEEYATWDDAERVALALLSDPRMRASWNADPDETMPNVDAYGVT